MLKEYALELLFDPKTEATLLRFYEQLEHAGFGLPESVVSYQPHITLNVCNVLKLEQLELRVAEFAKAHPSFPLVLSHLGCFLAPYPVVFLAPTIPKGLFDFHADFLETVTPFISATRSYYEPDAWVPHCTLAFDFEASQLSTVVNICSAFSLPITATLSSIALVEVPKGKKVFGLKAG